MSEPTRGTRRILIALDPAAPRRDPFTPVAALVRMRATELTGLFVEDINLLRLSTLPFVQEIRPGPGAQDPQRIDRDAVETQLQRRANEVRRAFEAGAADLHARYRFNVRRGEVLDELAAAARDAEMLVIGRSVRSAGSRTWLGLRFDHLAEAAQAAGVSLVFVREPWASGSRVVMIWDGSESAARGLDTARAFAAAEGLDLTIAVAMADGRARERELEAVAQRLEAAGERRFVYALEALDAAALRALCSADDARVVVLPDDIVRVSALDLGRLLAELPTSLVLQH